MKLQLTISKRHNSLSDTNTFHLMMRDSLSKIRFVEIELTGDQLMNALTGLGEVSVEGEVRDLHKVGKKLIVDSIEFEIDGRLLGRKEEAKEKVVQALIDQGKQDWTPDLNFSSQNSFFMKDNKNFARTTIRKWE